MIELLIEIDWSMFAPLIGALSFGSSKSTSRSTINPDVLNLISGVFGDESSQTRALAGETLESIRASLGRDVTGGLETFDFNKLLGESEIGQELQRTLLNPSFTPTTQADQAVVDATRDQILGSTALKGLKPTTGGITQGLAPILSSLRQRRIGNLSSAFQTEVGARGGGRGQDVTQRGQTIGGDQAQIDAALNSFLSLLSLGRQTPVVTGGGGVSTSKAKGTSFGF